MRLKIKHILVSITLTFLLLSCRKFDQAGSMPEPGIALTFDDDYIDNWYKYLPLLDSLNVKATFYISNYHKFSPLQVQKLKTIEAHGNEIGYHTTNHIDIPKYIDRYGLDQLVKNEINPDLVQMRIDGFNPQVFAYPYGAHNLESDNLLLDIFKSIRYLNGSPNFAKSLTSSNKELRLYGMELDLSSKRKDWMYDELINSARENGNCFILVGHRIENGNTNLKVPLYRLLHVINKVKEMNMRFYTVSEISRK